MSSCELVETCPCVPDRIGSLEVLVFKEREKPDRSIRRKTSWSEGKNQQQTQPTYGRRQDSNRAMKLVGGECSHHIAILVL